MHDRNLSSGLKGAGGRAYTVARLLDKEYANAIKAGDAEFDWSKLPIVRELAGEAIEDFMVQAVVQVEASRKRSHLAAFGTFRPERISRVPMRNSFVSELTHGTTDVRYVLKYVGGSRNKKSQPRVAPNFI